MTKANAIRKYCLECAGGSPGEATLCHIVDCPLWTYRFGTSINDRRFELRMKAAMRDYPDEIGEVLSLIAGYLQICQILRKNRKYVHFLRNLR